MARQLTEFVLLTLVAVLLSSQAEGRITSLRLEREDLAPYIERSVYQCCIVIQLYYLCCIQLAENLKNSVKVLFMCMISHWFYMRFHWPNFSLLRSTIFPAHTWHRQFTHGVFKELTTSSTCANFSRATERSSRSYALRNNGQIKEIYDYANSRDKYVLILLIICCVMMVY